jgi:threonylcarbamoyladenosine tRNA methylthiotransferase MtaB
MPNLHLPAQSGSDAVLRRMARRNRASDFEALVAAAHARIPGLAVTTDLIAGFPGETEADFAETVAFARRVGFAHVHVFPFSARKGTAAARFGSTVPGPERRRRSRVLVELDGELSRAARQAFIGQERPVLWESRVETHSGTERPGLAGVRRAPVVPPGSVAWSGFTDNYLRVHAVAPGDLDLHNRIISVRLVRLDGDVLWGEVVAGDHD